VEIHSIKPPIFQSQFFCNSPLEETHVGFGNQGRRQVTQHT